MIEIKTLYRHSLHYLSGRIALMLLGFLSFPILTRVFSVSDYGTMGLVLKVILLFTVLGKFGLQNSVQRFHAEHGASSQRSDRQRYYSTLALGAVGMGALVALLFFLVLRFASNHLLNPELRYLFLVTSVLILIRSIQPTLIGFFRAEGRTKTYNAIEVGTRAATVLLACALLLWWRRALTVFFSSTIAVELLVVLGLLLYFYRNNLLHLSSVDWSYFKGAALFAFPLIGYELASVVLDAGDRILVQRFLGAESLGYYSAAYNVSTYVEESLMLPINLALMPIYMKLWVDHGEQRTRIFLSDSLNMFLALAVAVVCVVQLTAKDVIIVLASTKFQKAYTLLPVLVVGLLIYAMHIFLNAALLIHKKTGTMTRLVLYACVANLGLNIVLIPRWGLNGAAAATLLSYLLLVLLMGRISLRLLPLRISYVGMFYNLVAATATYLVVRPVEFRLPIVSACARGALAVLLYGALVALLNPLVREKVARIRRKQPHRSSVTVGAVL
jgi:O-antigen/teichoic acid export membrane protein